MPTHKITLRGYEAITARSPLPLGTAQSYGLEKLRLTLEAPWDTCRMISAVFVPEAAGAETPEVFPDESGLIQVPQAATAAEGPGSIVFVGVREGAQCVSCNLPYAVEGHAPAEGVATEMTPSGLTLLAEYAEKAEAAADRAEAAAGGAGAGHTVTPECFGAVGDGLHDDGPALKKALESGQPVILTKDLYLKSDILITDCDVNLDGQGHTIHCDKAGITIRAGTWDGSPVEKTVSGMVLQVDDAIGGSLNALTMEVAAGVSMTSFTLCGKNLLHVSKSALDDKKVCLGNAALASGGTYTFSLRGTLPANTGLLLGDNEARSIDMSGDNPYGTFAYDGPSEVTDVYLYNAAGLDPEAFGVEYQLEFGEAPTAFEEYNARICLVKVPEDHPGGTVDLMPEFADTLALSPGCNALYGMYPLTLTYRGDNGVVPGECSQVTNAVQSEEDAERSPYYRGYMTYKGRKTLQEEYADYTVTHWNIHTANLRNFTLDCADGDYGNGKGVVALSLYRMCDSVIDRVNTLLRDGAEGAAGILVAYGQNVRISNCYSRGWICANNRATDNRGYGFQLHGDNVTISNCSGEQCKHIISVGSVKNCWSTNITIDHCTFRTDFQKANPPTADGSQWFMEQIDVHGDAHNVVITGSSHYWWALDGNTQSAAIILLRNPTTVLSNCTIHSNGGWVSFGEMAEKMYIDQLHAPNVHLTTDARISGDSNPEHFMPELHVSGSEFARLRSSTGPCRVYMTNCVIREFVQDVQYLIARGCAFLRESSWAAQPTLVLTGESILSDCVIYGHRENSISLKTPVISAPENSVRMAHCKIYKRSGEYPLCDADQPEGSGNWQEDVFAFYLDTQCTLDKHTLH